MPGWGHGDWPESNARPPEFGGALHGVRRAPETGLPWFKPCVVCSVGCARPFPRSGEASRGDACSSVTASTESAGARHYRRRLGPKAKGGRPRTRAPSASPDQGFPSPSVVVVVLVMAVIVMVTVIVVVVVVPWVCMNVPIVMPEAAR